MYISRLKLEAPRHHNANVTPKPPPFFPLLFTRNKEKNIKEMFTLLRCFRLPVISPVRLFVPSRARLLFYSILDWYTTQHNVLLNGLMCIYVVCAVLVVHCINSQLFLTSMQTSYRKQNKLN